MPVYIEETHNHSLNHKDNTMTFTIFPISYEEFNEIGKMFCVIGNTHDEYLTWSFIFKGVKKNNIIASVDVKFYVKSVIELEVIYNEFEKMFQDRHYCISDKMSYFNFASWFKDNGSYAMQ
jgi:hypothetical protein